MSFIKTNIGERIKNFRELKNFTQEHVANILEMTPQGYGKIERNEVEVTISKLSAIAQILETSIEDILGFEERFVFNNQQAKIEFLVNHKNNLHIVGAKESYEAHIGDLKAEIAHLKAIIEKLLSK